MAANSRFAVAVHIGTLLALSPEAPLSSDQIAKSVNTNPVVVRRLLCRLCKAGIVNCLRGKGGGASLKKAANKISLYDIYKAVDADDIFAPNSAPCNQACSVSTNMAAAMDKVFDRAERALCAQLKRTSLAQIAKSVCKGA